MTQAFYPDQTDYIEKLNDLWERVGIEWKGAWNALTAYAEGDLVSFERGVWRRLVAGTTATEPDADATNWGIFVEGAAGPLDALSFIQAGTGAVSRTAQNKAREIISVKDFGVVGDGATDDTANIQLAFNAGANYFPPGTYMISSGLTYAGAGFDMAGGARFAPTGSGYTALTINQYAFGAYGSIRIEGAGNAVNGIVVNNPAGSTFKLLRATTLNGFGVKLNKSWDCNFSSISVEECGNTSEYAFSMNDDGDTCNHCSIDHLQVELSQAQAIYISPNTLACAFNNIHSERTYANASYTAWYLGGSRCTYTQTRLNGAGNSTPDAVNAKCLLDCYYNTYTALLCEGLIPVSASGNAGGLTLVEPQISGTYQEVPTQTGYIKIYGGEVASFVGQQTYTRTFGTKVGTGGAAVAYVDVLGYQESVTSGANWDIPIRPQSCILVVRDRSLGGVGVFALDETGIGSERLNGNTAFVLGAAGVNEIGVTLTGSVLRISNGHAGTKIVAVQFLGRAA